MNAVEIADAVTELFEKPFERAEFPFAFLEAFGIRGTTVKRLRTGNNNASDVEGGLLLRSNIHLATCESGTTGEILKALRESPQTAKAKAKFILATDGEELRAEDTRTGEPFAMAYDDFPSHFGAFLELGGISTVKEIKDNPIDIRATGRLNKLYVELLNANPEWQAEARRPDLNHFFARLIFCFFAEDTGIFFGEGLFTKTVDRMTESDGSNVHEVLETLFRAMNLSLEARKMADLPLWAEPFPYVNGGLFSGSPETPRFTKIARAYLRSAGELNWTEINPDIFGSMIQAVADDEERGALGMHYTSVPNILKVLNPLFLDDLRAQLERAGEHKASLLRLRERMARIRVFDPACGSGNFLVIAYKQMREIEAKINELRGEKDRPSEIPLTNFRGIEIRDFAAEVARLALIIAEYQADEKYRDKRLALAEFLPLRNENWIWRGNALRLDWTTVCPPTGDIVKVRADNLFEDRLEQTEMDFANAGGETYLCSNPPYKGGTEQDLSQKSDLDDLMSDSIDSWKSLDYVSGWFVKFASYAGVTDASCAFVTTSSITQGEQVARLWPLVFKRKLRIIFAYEPFKWTNLASFNAGVTVTIIGIGKKEQKNAVLFEPGLGGEFKKREVANINAYLAPFQDVLVEARSKPLSSLDEMTNGNKPADGGHLILSQIEARTILSHYPNAAQFVHPFVGAADTIQGLVRYCLWINPDQVEKAKIIQPISDRVSLVAEMRRKSTKTLTVLGANTPYAFQQVRQKGNEAVLLVPRHSSEGRQFLPVSLQRQGSVVADGAFALLNPRLWNFAILASRMHLIWVATVCGRIKTDYRYSNTLGWNTFPVPTLTKGEKDELTRCAEEILLARERHFPATIADLYDPEAMPDDLRRAHERNDETLERIYIGRRFKNDTERLEKLFEMYTAMVAKEGASGKKGRAKKTKTTADVNLL